MSAVTTWAESWPQHERSTKTVVPRRATLHDVGSGITHKRIICWLRYACRKGPGCGCSRRPTTVSKPLTAISANTTASATAASRDLRLSKPLTPSTAALRLVRQYLEIDDLLEKKRDA